jgi:acyl-CoA synthetase (AMP-forming)/AMP-acid ligase II
MQSWIHVIQPRATIGAGRLARWRGAGRPGSAAARADTESQSMISLLAPADHQPGHPRLASAGRVSFGWEVRVAGPDGRDLPLEAAGELLIRGEPLFSGYWRDPEATAAAFAPGGWYRTGDIGKLTADGYLYILDRATDMIISGGENIYPAEVEAVLARHPDVAGPGRGRLRGALLPVRRPGRGRRRGAGRRPPLRAPSRRAPAVRRTRWR